MLVHLKYLNPFGFEQFWKKEFVVQRVPRVAAYESGLRFPKFKMADSIWRTKNAKCHLTRAKIGTRGILRIKKDVSYLFENN